MDILNLIFPKKCLECGRTNHYMCLSCTRKVRMGLSTGSSISIFRYEGVVRKAIIALKYKYSKDVAEELVNLTIERLKGFNLPKDVTLVPIPMHKRKKLVRGFNQTEVLGEKLAFKLKVGYVPNLLIKSKSTKPQVGLKGEVRRKNLSGAFVVNPKLNPKDYKNIILFDDVYTTGSTLKEARGVLGEKGIKNVICLTIAR